jgi:DNA segregation ATPase FtsK/SpoIIIE-like protein
MADDLGYKYGQKDEKNVIFTDNPHRHAKLVHKLKYLNLTQSKFFRHIVTGLLTDDPRIMNYVEEIVKRSKQRKKKADKLQQKGIEKYNELGFSDDEMENIFDMIESEFPDL